VVVRDGVEGYVVTTADKFRQVAIVRHDEKLFGVRVRERAWWGGWLDWRTVIDVDRTRAWSDTTAQQIAAYASRNGITDADFSEQCHVVVDFEAGEVPC
jgi:hypothetical protein